MSFEVLSTDGVSTDGLAPLTEDRRFMVVSVADSTAPEFHRHLAGADALIVRSATTVDASMIGAASNLKVIGRAGVGIDNIDLAAASRNGVAVFNAPGGNTNAAAELAVGLMLALARKITDADRSVHAGRWERATFKGVELSGRTLGLIGAGRIGGEVARRCLAFGMDVIVYDPYLSEERARSLGVQLVDFETVVGQADVVSCHVPLTDETRGMIDGEVLTRMKDNVLLVNTSRGGVIDESALAAALAAGSIAGAALDVFEREPLPVDSPLLGAPRLVLTPHLGASTEEAQIGVALEVAGKIRVALGKGDLSDAVNAGALTDQMR